MPAQILVSVIIPSYNYAAFLPQAVASVLAQRASGLEVEVIVVDDGSTDDTAEVVRGMGDDVRYIYQENQGLSAARNAGLRAAQGEFVAFLDADDLQAKGMLASQLQVFAAQPELDIVICRCVDFSGSTVTQIEGLWSLVNSHWDVHACNANLAPVHCYLVRTALVRRAGFFDEALKSCEDQDYWLRCYGLGAKVGVNPDGLVLYRKHGNSMTVNRSRMYGHDSLMQEKIADMLRSLPRFPDHAKCAGWLAHAAGSLVSAGYLCQHDHERMLVMQDFFTRAVLNAAPLFRADAECDVSAPLCHIQYYYGGRCLRLINWQGLQLTPPAAKAVMVLKRMFPRLADISAEGLDARLRSTYGKLCISGMPPQLRAEQG
ncbi:MAG: glycosyltransferase [Desulfovibrio sp.]|uniref:glycosyltransferase family 2 protein n=1 Tax=Desulfovibrio sp. TaxID=885 RepID=UPI00135E758D|nr:glycosyltransferase [Desulfovibrio sp.]MTJ91439.1 glycosyltransferase [Desulfovibrio sp.]